jgi:hypothetical protein
LHTSIERKLDEASLNLAFKVWSEEEWQQTLCWQWGSYLFILTERATWVAA